MCGDSTKPDDVEQLMSGRRADLCFTSPPYGQQREYKSGGISDWDALMLGVFSIVPVTHEAQVLVNLGLIHRDNEWWPYWERWIEAMRLAGWRRFGWYVWDQGSGLPGDWNGRLAPSHEFIFHFNREAQRARKTKDKLPGSIKAKRSDDVGLQRKDGTLGRVTNPQAYAQPMKIPDSVVRVTRHQGGLSGGVGSHPAIFPVALVSEVLTAFSDPGDLVFEPFSGSGTQMISAEQNGRLCYGMELAPAYADVAVRRWQLFTGQTAIRERDGQPFSSSEREQTSQEHAA